jgi:PQQ-like domain
MRFLIKVLFLFVFVSPGFCETWERVYGRNQGDVPRAFLPTQDGGYLLTGGTEPEQNNAGFRVWVLKVGSLGKIQWQKTFGSGIGESIVSTPDGGYLIAASSQGDVRLLKINKFGNVLWQKTLDRPESSDAAIKLQTASQGGYVLTGYTNFTGNLSDIWIIRLDSQGRVIWQYTYGGPTFDVLSTIKETPDRGWIVVGYTKLGGTETIRGWIFKLKSTGEIEWQKAFGGNQDTYGMDVVITADGGFAVAGMTFDDDDTNGFLIRLSKNGNVIWQKMYGGVGYEQVIALETTTENNFVLGGDTGSFAHGADAFLLSIDLQGEILWQNVYGITDGRSLFLSLDKTKDSGYMAFGDISQQQIGQNFWLVKVDHLGNLQNDCGIQIPIQMESKPANFKIFPTARRPVARKYTIRTPHVRITNTDGFESSVCEK